MTIIEKIKTVISAMFSGPMKVSAQLNHDPFKGHTKDTAKPGKSVFFETELGEVLDVFTPHISFDESNNDSCRKYTLKVTTIDGFPLMVGTEAVSKIPDDADVRVVRCHGSLQLVSNKGEIEENPTNIISIILTKEPQGWAVASVHPGYPGEDMNKWIENKRRKEGDPILDVAMIPYSIKRHIMIAE